MAFQVLHLLFLLFVCIHGSDSAPMEAETTKLYIVYMGEKHHEDPNVVTAFHHEILESLLGSKDAALGSIVYSYRHGFSGFAAMLTVSQAKRVAGVPGVLRVKLSNIVQSTTTRSWDFLNVEHKDPSQLLKRANFGDGVIIGIIDSGIWPESKSFNDHGYGPIPQRWKGICQTGKEFDSSKCNRKIIGARFYPKGKSGEISDDDYLSPRDADGHGTHVASTAAGSYVQNANFSRLGTGLARGGAPRARLATYKVLWKRKSGITTGGDAEILKAIDDAMHDGVDILSLSLGGDQFSWDSVALQAVMQGIAMVFSGGNDGPTPGTVRKVSPWVITVAASTIDRSFPTTFTLGDGQSFMGQAIFYLTTDTYDEFHEIVSGDSCDEVDTLKTKKVAGKYVLCTMGRDELAFSTAKRNVKEAGGIGLIYGQYSVNSLVASLFPSIKVDFEVYQQILQHALSSSSPTAKISPTRTIEGNNVLAPMLTHFSSRGPNILFPGVIKPDVAAPGYNILAAVKDSYEFKSGTSMAAPHVSGVVALLKAIHSDWSPAAIKSALVTTASVTDAYGMPIMAESTPRKLADPFDYGGGEINPTSAADPGLIYDIDPREYQEFHCAEKQDVVLCEKPEKPVYHLNLPSISVPNLHDRVTVSRNVTNVGPVHSVYKLLVENPPGVEMEVHPPVLVFDAHRRVKSFRVTFRAARAVQGVFTFGGLTWYDGMHSVRIPVAVRVVVLESFADVS